jgi:hypothetical protein
MAKRSVQITLSNNTGFLLQMVDRQLAANDPCGGIWTDGWRPSFQIPPTTHASWQTESSGITTGTEGWVKWNSV